MLKLDRSSDDDSVKPKNNIGCPFNYGYFIVLFSFIMMALFWGIFHSFGVYLKPISSEFGWTRALTAGAYSLASFLSGLFTAFMGWLKDRFGLRIVMTICGFLLGLGCILMSFCESLWHFYLFFGIIVGMSMGGSFVPPISNVTHWFFANRGLMTGILASSTGVGALVIPQISNSLLLNFGWRTSFLITGITALAIVVIAAQFLKNPGQHGPAADKGFQRFSNKPHDTDQSLSLIQALGSPQFWLFSLTGFSYGYTLFSLTVHVVPHAMDLGIMPGLAAGLLSTYGGLSVVGKIIFGKVLDRISSKKTMFTGYAMVAIAYVGIVFAERTWAIFLSVGFFGFFYGACTVSQSPITAILFGLKSHGLIMGVFGISVTFGGAIGPFLTGAIFDHTGSYRIAFTICIAVALVGLFSAASLRQSRIKIKTECD